MKALWAACLALVIASGGAQGAPVPSILTAASNADLSSYAISAAPNGLQRCGYMAPGDSPCLPMQPSSSPCSLTAFVGTVTTAVVPTITLNVTAVTSGALRAGLPMPASAPGIVPGTMITKQISGTIGGVGTYELSQAFNPPPSFTLTVRGDGTTQVSSADNKCWLGQLTNQPDASLFGVVCDGVFDNSLTLQAALSVSNRFVQLPVGPGNCKFSTTLKIGNGSTAAVSTVNNVYLGSLLSPIVWLAGQPQGLPILEYSGSTTAINIVGQLQGWGIRGVKLLCDNNAATGILNTSGEGGDSYNSMIAECKIPYQPNGIASLAPGTFNGDVYRNTFKRMDIEVPPVTGAVGINSSSLTTWDVDMELWEETTISFDPGPGSGISRTCIYGGFGDSNVFRHIHCIILSHAGDTILGVVMDYGTSCGIGGCANFPNSYVFDDIDTGAADVPKWRALGSRVASAGPNFALNIPLNNGGTDPFGVSGLWVDHSPWQPWTPTTSCDLGSHSGTSSATGLVRQVGDSYEFQNTFSVTAVGTCAFFYSSSLWATTPCRNNSTTHAPWMAYGQAATAGTGVNGTIDPTASPQLLTARNYNNTALPAAAGDKYTIQGICQGEFNTP